MGITSALVLFVVIWFLTFLTVIPIRLKTQGDTGHVVQGTHASSPEVHNLKKKALITTVIAMILWGGISAIIISGAITVRDFDWRNVMPPVAEGN